MVALLAITLGAVGLKLAPSQRAAGLLGEPTEGAEPTVNVTVELLLVPQAFVAVYRTRFPLSGKFTVYGTVNEA